MLEADSRSLQSLGSRNQRRLSPCPVDQIPDGLSRRDSLSSIVSAASVSSISSSLHCEDCKWKSLCCCMLSYDILCILLMYCIVGLHIFGVVMEVVCQPKCKCIMEQQLLLQLCNNHSLFTVKALMF